MSISVILNHWAILLIYCLTLGMFTVNPNIFVLVYNNLFLLFAEYLHIYAQIFA